jgi:hypothetical protein
VPGCRTGSEPRSFTLVRRRLELYPLDAKLTGALGLVAVPVLDRELGHLAVDEELDGLGISSGAVQTPGRMKVTCVTPLGEEVASTL